MEFETGWWRPCGSGFNRSQVRKSVESELRITRGSGSDTHVFRIAGVNCTETATCASEGASSPLCVTVSNIIGSDSTAELQASSAYQRVDLRFKAKCGACCHLRHCNMWLVLPHGARQDRLHWHSETRGVPPRDSKLVKYQQWVPQAGDTNVGSSRVTLSRVGVSGCTIVDRRDTRSS